MPVDDKWRTNVQGVKHSSPSRNSSPFRVWVARFHRSENSTLESSHVLEYLDKATSEANETKSQTRSKDYANWEETFFLTELSCEATLSDDSISAMQILLEKNHRNVFLTTLRLPRNQLSAAAAESLVTILKATKTLVHLDIRHNKLGTEGLATLVKPLTEHGGRRCSLISLNLADNKLKRKAALILAELLGKNKTLKELHLGHNPLKPQGMKEILSSLQANEESKLARLDIRATALGGKAMKALIELLSGNETISSLNLSSNNLGGQGAVEFSTVFRYRNRLQDVSLGRNEIGPEGISAIANILNEDGQLQGHCHLQWLTLDWNQIGDEGCIVLASSLAKNSTLQYLDLCSNNIGSPGASHLASMFAVNFCLKVVLLNDNVIDDDGAIALACCLRKRDCRVEKISWENNFGISKQSEFMLIHAFEFRKRLATWLGDLLEDLEHDRLVSINWWTRAEANNVTDWEVDAVVQVLIRHNPKLLESMYLVGQYITQQSLGVLCNNYLSENPPLQRLYLKRVSLRANGGTDCIGRALCTNTTLRVLSITQCDFSTRDAANLALALKHNSTLERINLQGNKLKDEGFGALWNVINPKCKNNALLPHVSLVSINVSDNSISDVAMALVGESFSVGRLMELHLDHNLITDRGALDLSKAVMGSPTLKVLSVAHNRFMTHRGQNALRLFASGQFSS